MYLTYRVHHCFSSLQDMDKNSPLLCFLKCCRLLKLFDDLLIISLSCLLIVNRKAYQEDYPGGCAMQYSYGGYVRKHNPFISFKSVHLNATRCAKIVPATQLDIDLATGNLPQYSFYTPTMDNDGHEYVRQYSP